MIEDSGGLTIVDAGLPFAPAVIVRQLRAAGRDPREVKHILVTHAHPDHVGGLPVLKALTGARVIASALERAVVEGRVAVAQTPPEKLTGARRYVRPPAMRLRGTVVDQEVANRDLLDIMGGLEVIATPGHTPGHVSYWQPRRRILLCGDVMVNGLWLRLPAPAFTYDMEENRRSIGRLARLEARVVCTGHGEPLRHDAAHRVKEFARRVAR